MVILKYIVATMGMLAVGWLVWRLVQASDSETDQDDRET